MKIFYRISESSYRKNRVTYGTKENCFTNFLKHFPAKDITVLADNVSEERLEFLSQSDVQLVKVEEGHGALTFKKTLELSLELPDDEIIYFVEDDYIHRGGSRTVLEDALSDQFSFDYVTLYDHPDKYLNPFEGGNPLCSGRSEETRVYLGKHCHFKQTNSTTMTFATKVKTLRQDQEILNKWTSERHPSTYPYDFHMFLELRRIGRVLVSPLPGFCTHGEVEFLSPLIDWENEV